jgi:hypothetical protein
MDSLRQAFRRDGLNHCLRTAYAQHVAEEAMPELADEPAVVSTAGTRTKPDRRRKMFAYVLRNETATAVRRRIIVRIS